MNRFFVPAVLCAALVCFARPCAAWEAVVSNVHDGDTVTVAPGAAADLRMGVRLYGIDAPELDQPHGPEAAAALAGILPVGAVVEVVPVNTDRYGRVVGLLVHEGRTINLAMIEQGWAWQEPKYCRLKFCRAWAKAEARAREAGIGLWADPAAPPWEWRKAARR